MPGGPRRRRLPSTNHQFLASCTPVCFVPDGQILIDNHIQVAHARSPSSTDGKCIRDCFWMIVFVGSLCLSAYGSMVQRQTGVDYLRGKPGFDARRGSLPNLVATPRVSVELCGGCSTCESTVRSHDGVGGTPVRFGWPSLPRAQSRSAVRVRVRARVAGPLPVNAMSLKCQ